MSAAIPRLLPTAAIVVIAATLTGCGNKSPISTEAAQSGQGRLTGGKDRLYVAEFSDYPDLRPAMRIRGWRARGDWVVRRLRQTAARSQGEAIRLARSSGAVYRSEWIANVMVIAGEKELGSQVGGLPGVRRVWEEPFPLFARNDFSPAPAPRDPTAALRQANVPAAWKEGITGKGVTVGVVDTGVDAEHPALLPGYRGYRGPGRPLEHDGNWFSPIRRSAAAPVDNADHGTHMAGLVAGRPGKPGGAPIGVAPDAQWIAAAACTSSACPLSGVLPGLQFMLAPTDRYRAGPNPDLRPEVVVNSWQRDSKDVALERGIEALEAAGVLPVFAVGNGGPACGSARTPGTDPNEVLSVGAVNSAGQVASFSGRGPAPGGLPDPDVTAPGEAVVSSVPPRGYASADGTSPAAALTAGVAALAIQANPSLKGNLDGLVTAMRAGTRKPPGSECGETDGGRRNNAYGYGEIDAKKVVAAARKR